MTLEVDISCVTALVGGKKCSSDYHLGKTVAHLRTSHPRVTSQLISFLLQGARFSQILANPSTLNETLHQLMVPYLRILLPQHILLSSDKLWQYM